MKPFRLLINDVNIMAQELIPDGYRRTYRVPATNCWLYCRKPLNYLMIALEWTWRGFWEVIVKMQMWIPKYILYSGTTYELLKGKDDDE